VAPGNSVGTLTVAGDYTQLTGSVLELEFNDEGRHDRLVVEGRADIQGGELRLLGLRPEFLGRNFALLSAAGGVSGGLDRVAQEFPFLNISPVFSDTDLSVSVHRSALPFAAFAANGNQRAVAAAVERQSVGDWPYTRLIGLRSALPVAGLLHGLSGELHASAQSVLLDAGDSWRQMALTRVRNAQSDEVFSSSGDWRAWGQGFGQWGRLDGSGAASGVHRRSMGVAVGAERMLGVRWHAGFGAGVSYADVRGAGLGRVRADGYQLTVFSGWTAGAWRWRLGAAYGWHRLRSSRHVDALGGGAIQARYRQQATQLFAELGYGLSLGKTQLEPYLGLAQIWQRNGSFQERGGPAALSAGSARLNATVGTLGLRARWRLAAHNKDQYTIVAGVGWRRMLKGLEPTRAFRLSSGHGFEVAGAPVARDALALELDLSWRRQRTDGSGVRFELGYRGQLASRARDHGAQLRVAWSF